MIRMSDFQTTQAIGMNVLCQTQLAQVSFRIKSHDAHFSKQPSHAFGANQEIQTKKFALASLAQIISRGYYFFFEGFSIPNCSEALLQKSTSTSKRPIFSYNAFSRLAASSSGAFVEKISVPPDSN